MSNRILMVDDESFILDGFRRNLRGKFSVTTAVGPLAGLEALANDGPFAVVVSDLQMPEMDGISFLTKCREQDPDMVRMMLTGQADLNVSMAAVNDGRVFRFLTKPCDVDDLSAALTAGLEQYQLIRAERDLLEQTLNGAISVLTDVLQMVDETSQALAARAALAVQTMTAAAGLSGWEYELGAMLCQLGNLTLPSETAAKLNSGQLLTPAERKMADRAPEAAKRLLVNIPRLESVAEMIGRQDYPPVLDDTTGSDNVVAYGANLLHIAVNYERLLASGLDAESAIAHLEASTQGPIAKAMVAALGDGSQADREYTVELVQIKHLQPGMVLHEDVMTANHLMLLAAGHVITGATRERLETFAQGAALPPALAVRVPVEAPE